MAFKFESLRCWQKALELSNDIDEITKKWPKEERYVLTSQIKRASDSISLNIAEGSTGQTDKQYSTFLGYSIRSGIEVVGCIYLAKGRRIMSHEDFNKIYKQVEEIIIMTQALRNTLK